jgi:hypothetical protein
MGNRSTKAFTCFAAALAALVLSTNLSVAEEGPQIINPQFLEMLSTFQKKAAEASEAIMQNMKDASKNAEQSADQAQKFMESLSDFQKKAFGTTDSDNQNSK